MNDISFEPLSVQADSAALYRMIMDLDDQYLCFNKTVINSDVDFQRWIIDQTKFAWHDFYIIKIHGERAGFVHSYQFRLGDGHCKICVYIDKPYRSRGVGGLALVKFLHILFRDYPLRKVILEIFDYNKQSLTSNLQAGFEEEGCIKGYRYFGGDYYDLHILSMDRNTFYGNLARIGGVKNDVP